MAKGKAMLEFSAVVAAPPGRFDGVERPYSPADVLRLLPGREVLNCTTLWCFDKSLANAKAAEDCRSPRR